MDASDEVRTVARPHRVELERIKGSRFLADLAPAADEATALGFVEQVRRRAPDASHHCWAFRLAGGRERSDDDAEPGGTAGAPILRHLQGAGLVDVVAVVTRWFGGTKLGRGGLARAYGAATAAAIDEASVVVRPALTWLEVVHDYDLSGQVDAVLAGHGAEVVDADYGTQVVLRLTVPRRAATDFAAALSEATAGRVVPAHVERA